MEQWPASLFSLTKRRARGLPFEEHDLSVSRSRRRLEIGSLEKSKRPAISRTIRVEAPVKQDSRSRLRSRKTSERRGFPANRDLYPLPLNPLPRNSRFPPEETRRAPRMDDAVPGATWQNGLVFRSSLVCELRSGINSRETAARRPRGFSRGNRRGRTNLCR